MEAEVSKNIQFFIHDELHTVHSDHLRPDMRLNEYLREKLHLTGTKYMCKEGGCGACIVGAAIKHPVTKKILNVSVNSCLVPLIICQSWKIYTIEGIGNAKVGFSKIQQTLANFNGTQCGYCSPGMVMTMYSLLKANPNLTMKEMEHSFSGNLCRCTGYRSILTAFKTLCSDADSNLIGDYPTLDIEDLYICAHKENGTCEEKCKELCSTNNSLSYFQFEKSKWYKVFSISEIFKAFAQVPNGSYMLVFGNTSTGVYKPEEVLDLYIDITSVPELQDFNLTSDRLTLGANLTLARTIELFRKIGTDKPQFKYLLKMADHISLVANVPVRNIGTLAGNLTIKHEHPEFASDIFLLLEAVKATLTICVQDDEAVNSGVMSYLSSFVFSDVSTDMTLGLDDYVSFDMDRKVIKNIILPAYSSSYKFESYKIMPRAQNSTALLNAAFLLKFQNSYIASARIVYGGITPQFIHAKETEKYLVGKNLFTNSTMQGAFETLDKELVPNWVLPDARPEYRKGVAISVFYKFILSIAPGAKISPRVKSGGPKLERPLSSGTQDYKTKLSLYPVGEPIRKLEALAQASGSAEFILDMPDRPHQLFGAFVQADAPANSTVVSVDKSKALKMTGVVAYMDKNDIPGKNTFTPNNILVNVYPIEEPLFCNGTVLHYHQPIGMIIATSSDIAEAAAELVTVTYKPGAKPLLTIRDVLKANDPSRIAHDLDLHRTRTGNNVKFNIKGKFDIYQQYHFHMETHICSVVPIEDGLNMFTSTQYKTLNQVAAAAALNIPTNKVNVEVRRIGGAFGAKISRNCLISTACAVAAFKLQKPVKFILPFTHNMNICGKRFPFSMDYDLATDDKGMIQYLNVKIWSDLGVGGNEKVPFSLYSTFTNKYLLDTWEVSVDRTNSDIPATTWTRAPATAEGLAGIEAIMDHIAYTVGKDPLEVRIANMDTNEQAPLIGHINRLLEWADINNRNKDIEEFNRTNRWMKKGISVVPSNFPLQLFGNLTVLVSIYYTDGTVAVSHGGIESGQGINTKVAQTCAYALGITVDKISIKPSNTTIAANSFVTGGSITSEAICYGVLKSCEILNARIKVIRDTLPAGTPWEDVIKVCFANYVDLTATYMYTPVSPGLANYPIYGVCATEVLVDILTGNHLVTRVDLLEDTGDSLSPLIDIGQVEGAFVMGQGYYASEEFITTEEGKVLTNRTWNYKVPGALDIPIDFRVLFPENNTNPVGVLGSKATGEPSLVLSVALPLAIRHALASARTDADNTAEKWFGFDGPTTVAATFLNSLNDYKQYTL